MEENGDGEEMVEEWLEEDEEIEFEEELKTEECV